MITAYSPAPFQVAIFSS